MKRIHTLIILFIVASLACNQKKNDGNATNNDTPSPAGTGTYNGKEMRIKKSADTLPRKQVDLQVRGMEAQTLGDSTKIGRPGDMLLTFTGEGFLFTERNPVLRMGKEEISDTYSNETATELYVVVPAKSMNTLMGALRSGAISIVNPDKKEVRVAQNPEEMMNKMKTAERTTLQYTQYGVTRKRG